MIKSISIDLLVPFENHPFKKRSGIEQQAVMLSLQTGQLTFTFPALHLSVQLQTVGGAASVLPSSISAKRSASST